MENLEELIIEALLNNDHSAYYVGGYVRDTLLNIPSFDKDIVTNASYEEAKACLSHLAKVEEVGKNFGVLMVGDVEVAQFRGEEYIKTSKPNVSLVKTALEDSNRRDFTINSMYMDIHGNILDYHNGQEDIKNKIIRCVGNPDDRFKDDPSRILRGFYLASKLGFTIEENTLQSMQRNSKLLKESVPNELKGKLFYKSLKSGNVADFLNNLMITGLMDSFIPELSHLWQLEQNPKYHIHSDNCWNHVYDVIKEAEKLKPNDYEFIVGAVFHDVAKGLEGIRGVNSQGKPNDLGHEIAGVPIAKKVINRLGLGKDFAKKVSFYVAYHGVNIVKSANGTYKDKSFTKLVKNIKPLFKNKEEMFSYFTSLLDFRKCDCNSMTEELRTSSISTYDEIVSTFENYLAKTIIYYNELPVNGSDIIKYNQKIQGEYIKIALDCLVSRNVSNRDRCIQIISQFNTTTLDNFKNNS